MDDFPHFFIYFIHLFILIIVFFFAGGSWYGHTCTSFLYDTTSGHQRPFCVTPPISLCIQHVQGDPWLNRMTECLSHDQYQVTISCPRSLLSNCENLIRRTLLEGPLFITALYPMYPPLMTNKINLWLIGWCLFNEDIIFPPYILSCLTTLCKSPAYHGKTDKALWNYTFFSMEILPVF